MIGLLTIVIGLTQLSEKQVVSTKILHFVGHLTIHLILSNKDDLFAFHFIKVVTFFPGSVEYTLV
jgi:hypothetical protein